MSETFTRKNWLITGISSGIGRSPAEKTSPSTTFTPTARLPPMTTLSTSASPRIARFGRARTAAVR